MNIRTTEHGTWCDGYGWLRREWSAIDADTYDGVHSPVGVGTTEDKAIADLLMQLKERAP